MLLISAGLSCALPAQETALQKADSRLRELAQSHPDSVVRVLLRAARPVTDAERAQLERARLRVGSVIGDVVTGTVRAGDVEQVTALTFVIAIEHSREIPVTQP